MRARLPILALLALVALAPPAGAASRRPDDGRSAARADFTILGYETVWDADGLTGTSPDTLHVPPGARIRWHRTSGVHTITDGRGLLDPFAGSRFDYLLDEFAPDFDTTFAEPDTIPFFCAFHDPGMRGVLIVSARASVPEEGPPSRLVFARPPTPNPSRGAVTFTVGLPRAQNVALDIRDIQGRRVARLHAGELPPGEHPFRWRGMDDSGRRVPSGVYVAWLTDGDRVMSRRFALLN